MLQKSLLYVLGALMFILWAGQQVQAQTAADNATNGKTCPELWPVKQGEKWGFIDKTGRLIIPFKFDGAKAFSEGLAAVKVKEKVGYIDETGKFVIPPRFISGYPFSGRLALVILRSFGKDRKDIIEMNQLGYVDRSGKLVIQLKEALDSKSLRISYQDGDLTCSEGMVRVQQNDKVGFMDKAGRQVIPPRYDEAGPFSEGLAAVKLGGKYGYLDRFGKEVVPLQFSEAGPFSEGLAAVKLGDKYGYLDRSGKVVIPPQFSEADLFSEGLAQVSYNGNQGGYIDKSGKLVITGVESAGARRFSGGLAAVKGKNDKYGFIDRTGNWVTQPQFDRVGEFSEGLAAVERFDKGWPGNLAYINPKGEIVIQSMSTDPNSPNRVDWDLHNYRFCGGVARVSAGNEADEDAQVYIDQEGKNISPVVIPPKKESPAPGKK
jgi:hypothetical protein